MTKMIIIISNLNLNRISLDKGKMGLKVGPSVKPVVRASKLTMDNLRPCTVYVIIFSVSKHPSAY